MPNDMTTNMQPLDYAAQISQYLVKEQFGNGDTNPAPDAVVSFAEEFWRGVLAEDLNGRTLVYDAQLTLEAWQAFAAFHQAAPIIEVGNSTIDPSRGYVRILHLDMPFITDTVLMELSRQDVALRYLHNVTMATADNQRATLVYAELDALAADKMSQMVAQLESNLADVRAAVADYPAMRERALALANDLRTGSPPEQESSEFLHWLCADHFTFLGYREFDFANEQVAQRSDTALGYLRNSPAATTRPFAELRAETLSFLLEPSPLSFSKAGTPSRVHRPAYPDYVGVREFDEDGNVVGEKGFLGLYTSPVYTDQPSTIPVVREKVANVLRRSGHAPGSFDGKALTQVLATFARDELFQSSEDELFVAATGVAHIHERRKTQAFLRRGRYGLFYNCQVYLPRDLLNTSVRLGIQELLTQRLNALDVEFNSYFSESLLVRLQYTLRVDPTMEVDIDLESLQQEIVALSRDWQQDLAQAVADPVARHFARSFSPDYQHQFDIDTAVYDIGHLARLGSADDLNLRFYRAESESAEKVHLKLFKRGELLPLSRVVPILEYLGFEVISEHPYFVQTKHESYSIQDFALARVGGLDLASVGDTFEEAFTQIWHGAAESDGFNALVLCCGMPWRDVALLRAYAGYMRQAGFGFERAFVAQTLVSHHAAAKLIIEHFYGLHDPQGERVNRTDELHAYLDQVPLLNEDRVLRGFLTLMTATVRTNFFQKPTLDDAGLFVLKLAASTLVDLPAPRPMFEIYVYAPDMEGVHLRSSRIARGGIRWSDRLEDYRTEVLGLVKAQIVKNAVIVPSGAKGGFVLKRQTNAAGEPLKGEAWHAEGVRCYRRFIKGLLSVTDNLDQGNIVPPQDVERRDGDDPYLVVAADKGTATFSDIANDIACERGFWLGDAFASGGSVGYDHKKMGITARGAWVSVQRHFRRLGIDPQQDPITVVGVGDMAGDVFGNGMLRSKSIRLLAAFNHLHIFIDPNPDAAAAFVERERLFTLPRSSWTDYNRELISTGGGIFDRSQKSIVVSPQMAAAFAIAEGELAPDALISAVLKAPVDLLWNGGIGTYVKAKSESHAQVGDRANDSLRVDGEHLRAKVVGEGGNLGLTHKGRIEFAQGGGLVNADFIDNAGGVDCSDHEVNAKILLTQVVAAGKLKATDRDATLLAQEDAVTDLVLANNFLQARCLSLASDHSVGRIDEYDRLALRLEKTLGFSREEADFPSEELLAERMRQGTGLSSPELATLFGYSKILLKQQLTGADLDLDPTIGTVAANAFPPKLLDLLPSALDEHRLRKEIVVTQVANRVVGLGGVTFVDRISEFTGVDAVSVVKAFWVVASVFDLDARLRWIDQSSAPVAEKRQAMLAVMRCVRRSTRWLVRLHRDNMDVSQLIPQYQLPVQNLLAQPELFLQPAELERYLQQVDQTESGDSTLLAPTLGFEMFGALALAQVAATNGASVAELGPTFLAVADQLELNRVMSYLSDLETSNHWRAMERDTLLDDLCQHQLALTAEIAAYAGGLTAWEAASSQRIAQSKAIVAEVSLGADADLSGIAMIVRKLVQIT